MITETTQNELKGILETLQLFEWQGSHKEFENGFDEWCDLGVNSDYTLKVIGEVQCFFKMEGTGGGCYESVEVQKSQFFLRGFRLFKEHSPITISARESKMITSAIWKIYKEYEAEF